MKNGRLDLENFPTSESAQAMLGYISKGFYDKSYVGKWIFQVLGEELDDKRSIAEDLANQFFPETATWGLPYHEIKWGLPVRGSLPYEERRKLIYQKRDQRGSITPYRMEVIIGNMTGRKAHVDDESTPANTFKVELEDGSNAVDVTAVIRKVQEIKQSHTTFTAFFSSSVYLGIMPKVKEYKAQYTNCGTIPQVSTGLGIAGGNVEITPKAEGFKRIGPISGVSGEAGQYPKTNRGLGIANSGAEAEIFATGYNAQYPETGGDIAAGTYPRVSSAARATESGIMAGAVINGYMYRNEAAGTKPMVSSGLAETGQPLVPEVNTENYQIRYRLCGNAFEI